MMESPNTASIPPSLFEKIYRPEVRVQFAWEQLLRKNWPIELLVVDSIRDVKDWFVPWYISDKCEVGYADAGATPLRLLDVTGNLPHMNPKRARLIEDIAASYAARHDVVHLDVPVYSLGKAGSLIIDRNHRLCGLVASRRAFKLIVFNVQGPSDPEVLPDLLHWTS